MKQDRDDGSSLNIVIVGNCAVCAVSMRNSELECLQCDAMYYVSAAGTCTRKFSDTGSWQLLPV